MAPIPRHPPKVTVVGYYDAFEVKHEYDERGDHRLEIEGRVSTWECYGEIAKLEHKGITFCATTEYWWDTLPEIFVVAPVKEHEWEREVITGNKRPVVQAEEKPALTLREQAIRKVKQTKVLPLAS